MCVLKAEYVKQLKRFKDTIIGLSESQKIILIFTTILALVILGSHKILLQIPQYVGQGGLTYGLIPSSLKEKFFYYPILLLDGLSLPLPYATSLLSCFYQLIGAFSMFLFVKDYLKRIFKTVKGLIFPSYLGMLVYMFYPWNIMGDAFPTLIFVRALAPLCFIMLIKFLDDGFSFLTLFFGASILALMQMADPRSILFLAPISFFILFIPKLYLSSTAKNKFKISSKYVLFLAITLGLSSIEILYRLARSFSSNTIGTIPSAFISAYNLDVFRPNFIYANLLDIFRGMSFTATHTFYETFMIEQLALSPIIASLGQFFIFFFAIILPLIFFRKIKNKRFKAYFIPSIILIFITIMLFGNFYAGFPIFAIVAFAFTTPQSLEIIQLLILMFRTTRFLNFVFLMSLSLLTGLIVYVISKRKQRSIVGFLLKLFNKKKNYNLSIYDSKIVAFLIIINISLWSLPLIISGNGPTQPHPSFEVSDRTLAYSSIISQIDPYPATQKMVAMNPWAGGEPHLYFLSGVEAGANQFVVRYTVDNLFSPIIEDGDYAFMNEILSKMGITHLVVDEYRINNYELNFTSITNDLIESEYFELSASADQLQAFELIDNDNLTISSSGIFVLGGFEDYRAAFPIFNQISNNTIIPLFIDSFLDVTLLSESTWPLLLSPRKSLLDLVAPISLKENSTIVVSPSKWTTDWNRFKNWSPGYITDTSGGSWSYILYDIPNYEWSYSYRPDYGYAWVADASDVLAMNLDTINSRFTVIARVLMTPNSGEISFKLDDVFSKTLITSWEYDSSEFQWVNLGEYNLEEGSHTLVLENIEGINAVNLILFIPTLEFEQFLKASENFVQERDIIYVIDGDRQYLDPYRASLITSFNNLKNSSYTSKFLGNFSDFAFYPIDDVFSELRSLTVHQNQLFELNEGEFQLEIPFNETVYTEFFEEWNTSTGIPYLWSFPEDSFQILKDTNDGLYGKYSYAFTTDIAESGTWSWARGPEIDVKPGAKYSITTNMKLSNAKQSHIIVEGISSNGSIICLGVVPQGEDGSFDWKRYELLLNIPEDVEKVQLVLNAGWVQNSSLGAAITYFDAFLIKEETTNKMAPTVMLYSSEGSLKDILEQTPNILNLKNINTTIYDNNYLEYEISLRLNGSAIITIPEVYDGTWLIETDTDVDIYPLVAYYLFSGFQINSKNSTDIEIHIFSSINQTLRLGEYVTFSAIGLIMLISTIWYVYKLLKKRYHFIIRLKRY